MEYQKIINLLDKIPNQPSKFRIKNWIEIHDDSSGTWSINSQIKFNPKTAGLFEGSFFWAEVNLTPTFPSYFKKNLSNINITLYNC